jgi:hypothetical protein
MEGSDENGRRTGSRARTKRGLVIEVWVGLGRAAVGEDELREVQRALAKRFGESAVDSPASIARLLADEGAELRHPEVIEFDARWRQTQIERGAADFSIFDRFHSAKPVRLKQAEVLITKVEKLRRKYEQAGDGEAMRRLREQTLDAKTRAQSLAASDKLIKRVRNEQAEIAEWLAVWIRTPKLFEEWLELRKRSPDFQQRFP